MSDQTAEPQNNNANDAPDWARKAISDANSEAAKYRVERNALKQQLDEVLGEKTQLTDTLAEAEKARDAANMELLRLRVALDAGIPGDRARTVAERLQGTTEDELKADASKLVQEFGLNKKNDRATDPSQGRGQSGPITNTPQAEFAHMMSQLDVFRK